MTYYLIGSGNMATFIAKILHTQHCSIGGIYGRNTDKAAALAAQINASVISSPAAIPDGRDTVCIICVPDSAISEVAAGIGPRKETIVVHTSGTTAIRVLAEQATHYGCIWPMGSVISDSGNTNAVPACIDASDTESLEALKQTAALFASEIIRADDQQRRVLHLCAVLTQNFSNHLFAIAERLCAEKGLEANLLKPMLHDWLRKLDDASARAIQTGPARRGDKNTLEQHRLLLAEDPQLLKIYDSLTESIRKMYG